MPLRSEEKRGCAAEFRAPQNAEELAVSVALTEPCLTLIWATKTNGWSPSNIDQDVINASVFAKRKFLCRQFGVSKS